MKIRDVKTYILASPGRDYVLVKVTTDEGLYGWGEGTLERKERAVAAAVEDLKVFVLGEDPTRIDYLWQRMYRHGFWRGGEVALSAMAGIETALWDITGKAYGQPVYKLLGGAVRDFLPCYTHTGDPAVARELMAKGWNAFKSGPFFRGEALSEAEIVRRSAKQFEAMREAVGPEGLLMCDCHGKFRPATAVRLAKALEPYDLYFFEEPTPPDNPTSIKLVREAGLSMDIATGERLFTKWDYRELLEKQLVDIIQPDLIHCGGIKETVKIAAYAEVYDVRVAPHNPNGPVGTAASVHACLVMPNFHILEYANSPTRDACQRAIVDGDVFRAKNGRIEPPTLPGLGIDIDEEYLAAHPFVPRESIPGVFEPDGGVSNV